MSIQEYFRLPAYMRLSRKQIAQRMSEAGFSVTPETIGNWAKSNKVPGERIAPLLKVLNDEKDKNNGVNVNNFKDDENEF